MMGQTVADPGWSDSGLRFLLVDDDAERCSMMRSFFSHRNIRLEVTIDSRRGLDGCLQGNIPWCSST